MNAKELRSLYDMSINTVMSKQKVTKVVERPRTIHETSPEVFQTLRKIGKMDFHDVKDGWNDHVFRKDGGEMKCGKIGDRLAFVKELMTGLKHYAGDEMMFVGHRGFFKCLLGEKRNCEFATLWAIAM